MYKHFVLYETIGLYIPAYSIFYTYIRLSFFILYKKAAGRSVFSCPLLMRTYSRCGSSISLLSRSFLYGFLAFCLVCALGCFALCACAVRLCACCCFA